MAIWEQPSGLQSKEKSLGVEGHLLGCRMSEWLLEKSPSTRVNFPGKAELPNVRRSSGQYHGDLEERKALKTKEVKNIKGRTCHLSNPINVQIWP